MSCGIILAGGESSRMGADKALIEIEGATMLERAITTLQQLTPDIIVVGRAYAHPGVRSVPDNTPGLGPLGGIVTGLAEAGEGLHFVTACDMPLLAPALLQRLLQRAIETGAEAVVPIWQGHPEPLCALYSQAALPKLQRFLEEGGRAVKKSLESITIFFLPEEEVSLLDPEGLSLINLNTPEELEGFRRRKPSL